MRLNAFTGGGVKRTRYMTGVSVGHSASCVMCLVDTMWVPLVVSLSSLFKKAFSYTRGAGFAQVRGERGPTAWLGLHLFINDSAGWRLGKSVLNKNWRLAAG